ncbi:hypothetical protein BK673_12310 [Pseudomonas fluorescens]|uniref:Uncharacterized protein n=1 Tax=Pseudomonas fluorescens TaxID=294 RepID=A0A423P5Y6_PSEFL|nr:hypothetical protein [Pseudomonas fluorescens]ROO09684.1 hypothetical protein BK673_12310 [Pseudomonas fluorescens]
MMKTISYYRLLPDSMPEEDVAKEFYELLKEASDSEKLKHDFLEALLELSDRQWHTCKQLRQPLKAQIEKILIDWWDGFDFVFAEGTIVVAAQLGLVELFEFISSRKANELSPEVAVEIKESIAELGDNIADPYSGM